ncbi:MAG: hypothetical protein KJO60_14940 [Desulfofustis sp.]|nr:hypothetical protein [Desulfofustis sp.]
MDKSEERMAKIIQRRFGYSDEELQTFLNDPRNMELVSRRKEFERTRFVLEVAESCWN